MFQPAYKQYVYTDESFCSAGSYWLLSPEASTHEDAQIRRRYVTTCEKSDRVVKCVYSDMHLFEDDICVFKLGDHAGLR
jgi:hypothetical protein